MNFLKGAKKIKPLSLESLNSGIDAAWAKVGKTFHHGINLPLFSLRKKNDTGIGEFLDLIPLIDWCSQIGFDLIQLLPLNDSGLDPSPYNALSSVALHPIYISLKDLPFIDQLPEAPPPQGRLNHPFVLSYKLSFLREYHQKVLPSLQKNEAFSHFQANHPWLKPYALFKVLKELHGHRHWNSWDEKDAPLEEASLEALYEKHAQKMLFHIHLQFLAFEQLQKVKAHADKKGVFLKGDIPILISPDSHDVWVERTFFDLQFSAGAPPDAFNIGGQNWGFPIYNWEKIKESDFLFWKRRLATSSLFYHLYRIDHIIGFYHIWAIPQHQLATSGAYIPLDPDEALFQGEFILETLLSLSCMLPIGEDLGMITEEIRHSMTKLSIPGTRVPRWERYYASTKSFIPYNRYSPLSVTTLSTHDSETLAGWWVKFPQDAKEFAHFLKVHYEHTLTPKIRHKILLDSHKTASLFHINLLQEYLALIPSFVSDHPEEERINQPGTQIDTNWSYRFLPTVEEITASEELMDQMRSFSGKGPSFYHFHK